MKLPQDTPAKYITWKGFAACFRGIRFENAAKEVTTHNIDRVVALPRKNLLDHPTELLSMIVDATEKSSLANLRLTCGKLHDLTNDAFGSAFFVNRHIVFSKISVDTLLEITEHPRFGRYVEEIAFADGFLQGPLSSVYQKTDYLHTFCRDSYSIMSKVFQNVQKNHGSVDLMLYEHPDRIVHSWPQYDLGDIFFVIIGMVEGSKCTIGRVWIAGLDWQNKCPDGPVRMFAEVDCWGQGTKPSNSWIRFVRERAYVF